MGKYDLPGVPFKTCFVPLNDKPENLILFVVFVNNANEKGLLASSSLHRVQIKLKVRMNFNSLLAADSIT